jgi:hypothetical protein
MKNNIIRLAIAVFALAALAFAQGPMGPGGQGGQGTPGGNPNPPRTNVGVNMTTLQVMEGRISSIQIGFGAQYPTIIVNEKQIKVAPVWFLIDNDFELATGDMVKVKAAASNAPGNAYLYAIEITRGEVTLTLRNEAGAPLWTGGSNGRGNSGGNGAGAPSALRTGAGCIAPETIRTVTGAIAKLTAGAGIQHPSMDLKVDASIITIKLGPERILLGAELELDTGSTVTVKYGVASCTGENLALEITGETGATLKLREDDGRPAWN